MILDHRRSAPHSLPSPSPLQRQAARDASHILRQSHRSQHLRTEHSAVSDLRPAIQIRVEPEDLHRRLRVSTPRSSPSLLRIERRLESDVGDSDLGEEVVDHSDQMAQIQVAIRHEQLHLVELREVRRVHRLVSEHAVDREALHRLEALGVLRRLVQLLRAHRRRVRSQNVLHRLATVPLVAISERSEASFRVDLRHVLQVILRNGQRRGRVANEERVLRIAGRMALRLEQRVEVPERRLHELVGGHLREAHLQKDLAELRSHHQQRMQVTALRLLAQGAEIVSIRKEKEGERVRLERDGAEIGVQHVLGDVGLLLASLQSELLAFLHFVVFARAKGEVEREGSTPG